MSAMCLLQGQALPLQHDKRMPMEPATTSDMLSRLGRPVTCARTRKSRKTCQSVRGLCH